MITSKQATKYATPRIERISLKDWLKGVHTAFDDARTPVDGLRGAGNMVLDMNGTLRPRPSLSLYGEQPTGTVLGEIFEFVKTTVAGGEYWEICMQNVAGTARPYVRKDGGSWQVTTGKTYSLTANAHYIQIDNKVVIMNGSDNLSYFNVDSAGTTNTVTPFTSLATPTAPTPTKTNLTNTTFSYYYRITANSTVGETAASTAGVVTVGKIREQWVGNTTGTPEFVTVTWSAVTNAQSYNVYVGSVSGQEFLVASGINGLSYVDDGTGIIDVTRQAPLTDSTAGPKTTRGSVINGRLFMVGDADNPRYVWFGGTGTNALNFSPFESGGNVEIGRGTKEFPVRVMGFRDGRGNPQITVLCRGTNGQGKRYLLTPDSLTVGETTIDFFAVTEDNGGEGTDSPDGVIHYNDSLWYPSRDGFKTTGTKPQLQNLLSTNRISNTIQTDIENLNTDAMDMCVGIPFEGRLYWALPVGDTTNNEIWVLDLDRKGAWMKPWSISADWLWLYNDNTGNTHFCALVDNEILEFSYSAATNDNGSAFSTSANSGIIKFSEDGMEWGKIIDVTFVFLRPQGQITVNVTGKTEDASLETVGSNTYNPESSIAGWGEGEWEDYLEWSYSDEVPTSFGDARATLQIEVDEILNWWKWDISSITAGVDFQLSDVIARFVRVGVVDTD